MTNSHDPGFIHSVVAKALQPAFLVIATLALDLAQVRGQEPLPRVSPIPPQNRQSFNLGTFYRKYTQVSGLPIVASDKPSDYALLEAAYIVRGVLGRRPDMLRALVTNRVRVAVIGVTEFPSDLPESSKASLREKERMDKRARGYGGNPVSMSEEQLLKLAGDAFPDFSMFTHEFAHSVHLVAMKSLDPNFDGRLQQLYQAAKRANRFPGDYRMINHREYWAVGVERWFNTNGTLNRTDPDLYQFIGEVFGKPEWRYQTPPNRKVPGHLEGLDRQRLAGYDASLLDKRYPQPQFAWRDGKLMDLQTGKRATDPGAAAH